MKDKVSGALDKVKEFFGKMSVKARVLLGVSVVGVIALAVVAAVLLNNMPYTTLFTGMTAAEITSASAYLEENGVTDYKIQNNDTILVQKNQEAQLKAKMVMAGYPKSGFGYATYTSMAGILATESDRRTAYLFDLQERMAAVIRNFDGVKDAQVFLVLGEDRRYVLDSTNLVSATAAVTVEMLPGAKLDSAQAKAIRNLVAKAVQGLDVGNISISDTNGNSYYGGDASSASDASALKLQLEEETNNRTRDAILQVLGPLFGAENVRIAVSSTVDVNRRVGESTTYASPEDAVAGQGIIGRRVYDSEIVRDGEAATGGVAGTATNSEIPTYVQNNLQANGNESYARESGTNDYNVDTNHEQVEYMAGTVSDMTIAISINSTTAGNINPATLYGHVARAAGIAPTQQEDKISIVSQPFYNVTTAPVGDGTDGMVLPPWALYAAAGGAVLFLVILLLLIILGKRGKKKKKRALAAAMSGGAPNIYMEQAAEPHADLMNIRTEKSMELRKDIRQFAEDNPEIAAQLVKSWMRGGEEGG